MMKLFVVMAAFCLAPSAAARAQDFMGYPCTQDCSGHRAGYDWAEDKGITDPDECGGHSNSFIEGCRSYAQEQQDEGALYDAPEEDIPGEYEYRH